MYTELVMKKHDVPDLTFLEPYAHQWVALSPDQKRVLSSGDTLSETASKLSSTESNVAFYMRVVPDSNYAPPAIHEILL